MCLCDSIRTLELELDLAHDQISKFRNRFDHLFIQNERLELDASALAL